MPLTNEQIDEYGEMNLIGPIERQLMEQAKEANRLREAAVLAPYLEAALRLADEAERVADKADRGPWQYNDFDGGPFKYCLTTSEGYTIAELYEVREPDDDGVTQAQANGCFAAHARTSVPALASTVRGLVERVRECPAWKVAPDAPGRWQKFSRLSGEWEIQWTESVSEGNLEEKLHTPNQFFMWYGPIPSRPPEESTNA